LTLTSIIHPVKAALSVLVAIFAAGTGALAQDTQDAVRETPSDPLAAGRLVAAIGGCANCHTAKEGAPLAGGDPIHSPFGTFYPPNITPDPATGIGGWSDEEFITAMREGISPGGDPYYPAFPYTSYTHMNDEDLLELKVWLDSVEPVEQASPAHVLRMPVWPHLEAPFDVRFALWGWRWLFFEPARFEPDPAKSKEWNRGAYLVEGPGHCAQCHTPRNIFGALDHDRAYSGSATGPDGEKIPDITQGPDGIGDWSQQDLTFFFKIGMMPDGDFVGSEMAKVVNEGTAKLSDADRAAIAAYLMDLPVD